MTALFDYEVGQRVRGCRLAKGYTQKELAEKIGVKYWVILHYEKGKRKISIKRLYSIAEVLSVSIMDLVPEHTIISDEKSYLEGEEVLDLVEKYEKVENQELRNVVYSLIKSAQASKESIRKVARIEVAKNLAEVGIDHIRFSPLNSNFQANVYNSQIKQVTEVIHAGGLVKRQIYDKYQEQVASINEYGQLEELNTYTKASGIGRITQLKSAIQIKPENGFYEDFAPYSFQERWKINNANAWQISPGQLQHLTDDLHSLQLNPYDISSASYGMRLCFSLQSEGSVIKFNDDRSLPVRDSPN